MSLAPKPKMDPFIKLMMEQDRLRKIRFNFIQKNKIESPNYFKTLDFDLRGQELTEKIEGAKSRKSEFEVGKRKMNIIWLHKWDLIKEKQDEMRRICNNIRMIKFRKTVMAKYITSGKMVSHIFDVFNAKRKAVLQEKKVNRSVV